MACRIAENAPLSGLRERLGLTAQCHSLRPSCVHGHAARSADFTMGAPGAILGYCQALFGFKDSPAANTFRIRRLLEEIKAPWAQSHELFWGHRRSEPPSEFVSDAIRPLIGTGRVPILISSLDPARDFYAIQSIVATKPAVQPGETILLRIVLNGAASIEPTAAILKSLISTSLDQRAMPPWWLLLQSSLTAGEWDQLRVSLGDVWQYANIAVNPFSPDHVFEFAREQITVAQIVLGAGEDISLDGTIRLAPGMKITGAPDSASYSLTKFFERLRPLPVIPTLILLGPTLPEWTDEINQERITRVLPLVRQSCDELWAEVQPETREMVWKMSA